VGAVNAGWSYERVRSAVLEPSNLGGRKVQDLADQRGIRVALKHLERQYAQAVEYVQKNGRIRDRNGALMTITEWSETVDRRVWRGQGQITDRNALVAVGARALALGSATSIPVSVRSLADDIGVTHPTAARSLRRVQRSGWLRVCKPAFSDKPTVYALAFPREVGATPSDAVLTREVCQLLHSFGPEHDAWRWKALGKGSQRVYVLVRKNFGAVAEIASQLGISKRAVYHHLDRLRSAALIENTRGRWCCTDRTLDEVAEAYGTAGDGDRQREHHRRQREGYHQTEGS
jgi:DNA-binding transcriptional ArsR family regulator